MKEKHEGNKMKTSSLGKLVIRVATQIYRILDIRVPFCYIQMHFSVLIDSIAWEIGDIEDIGTKLVFSYCCYLIVLMMCDILKFQEI